MHKNHSRPHDVGEAHDAETLILANPDRIAALHESGLSAGPDASMDRFAAMVRVQLRVSIALISLVDADRQIFPGMQGLPEPWATARQTPLTHSLCQHIVTSGEPLVLSDARRSPRVRDSLALPELGVVAYAGMPLTVGDGHVLGSLCAIDTEPRDWTEHELRTLTDLAAMCSTELRLRVLTHRTGRERTQLADLAQSRSQLLLNAARALAATRSLEQIRHQVTDLVSGDLTPTYVGLIVTEPDSRLRRVPDPRRPLAAEGGEFERYGVQSAMITAKAVRERRLLCYPDRHAVEREYPPDTMRVYRGLDLEGVACAPLVGVREILGVLVFGWNVPHPVDDAERVVITTIASYTAQALERVRFVEHRVSVAREMQQAMLTSLPDVPGLAMAARYLPSATDEAVGGDWYDAIPVPAPDEPGGQTLAVTVGDITGHDVRASTLMGQTRSMLRQAAWCLPGSTPATVVEALEAAIDGVPVPAHGTMVHSHLLPARDGSGRWTLRFTNAGHPPPVLLRPDGSVSTLDEHDMLFGFGDLRTRPRVDHDVVLEPGTTVFLYTDGLVERRDVDLDSSIAALCALLATLVGRTPRAIVDTVVGTLLGPGHHDDVVALAITT